MKPQADDKRDRGAFLKKNLEFSPYLTKMSGDSYKSSSGNFERACLDSMKNNITQFISL